MAEQKKHGPGGPPHGGHRHGFQRPKNGLNTLRRLLSYIGKRKWLLVIVVACVIVSALSGIASTYMIRPVLNTLVGPLSFQEKIGELGRTLLFMACIFLVGAGCSYVQSAIMAQLAHRGVNRLRRDLFDKMQSLPLGFYDSKTHGELMSRFSNDADSVQQCLEQSLVSLISSALTFVGVVAMMIYTSPILFVVTVATLAASMAVFALRGKKSRVLFQRQQAALGQMNGNIQEMIEGLKVVKAFTHEPQAEEEFERLNQEFFEAARDANYFASSIMPMAGNISNMGYAATAIVGGVLTFGFGFDIGGLAAFLQYSRQVNQPINQVSQQTNIILSALAGAERIFEIMDMAPEPDEGTVTLCRDDQGCWCWQIPRDGQREQIPVRGDVRLQNVDFRYVPEKPVLKNVTF